MRPITSSEGWDVRGKYDEQPGTKTKTSPRTKTKPYIREGTHESYQKHRENIDTYSYVNVYV